VIFQVGHRSTQIAAKPVRNIHPAQRALHEKQLALLGIRETLPKSLPESVLVMPAFPAVLAAACRLDTRGGRGGRREIRRSKKGVFWAAGWDSRGNDGFKKTRRRRRVNLPFWHFYSTVRGNDSLCPTPEGSSAAPGIPLPCREGTLPAAGPRGIRRRRCPTSHRSWQGISSQHIQRRRATPIPHSRYSLPPPGSRRRRRLWFVCYDAAVPSGPNEGSSSFETDTSRNCAGRHGSSCLRLAQPGDKPP